MGLKKGVKQYKKERKRQSLNLFEASKSQNPLRLVPAVAGKAPCHRGYSAYEAPGPNRCGKGRVSIVFL